MPFEPMSLPYWTVPSWNPNVNEARAAGEYPTAGWANQLQALHDATVTKVNEIGADVDDMSTSLGVLGDVHAPGSVIIAGVDGVVKGLLPGTADQVLQPNSNLPDGVEWVTLGGTPAKGSILAHTGTEWVAVPPTHAQNGWFLRYDTLSPSNVSWVSDTTTTAIVEYVSVAKAVPPAQYWTNSAGTWTVHRLLSGVVKPAADLKVTTQRGGAYTSIPNGTTVTFGTVGPAGRPTASRTAHTLTVRRASDGGDTGQTVPVTVGTDGVVSCTYPGSGGPFSLVSDNLNPVEFTILPVTNTYTI